MEKLALDGGRPAVTRPIEAFSSLGPSDRAAVNRVMDRGLLSGFYGSPREQFFGGPEIRAFEDEWREKFGVAHAVSVNSATSGLIAALAAAGIGPGDEVIVPPFTMSASVVAPLVYGALPVFVDIEPETFCLDLEKVEAAIGPRTKVILVVNLFGHPARLAKLRALADRKGVMLIEDNAQAILSHEDGALAGTIGHIGIFSLNIHKHIQCGEGGVCITHDADLAKRMQLVRNHGENVTEWLDIKDLTNLYGFNFRMAELSAAIARSQLSRVDELVGRAEHIGSELTRATRNLKGVTPPAVRPDCRHVYFMWTMHLDAAHLGTTRAAFCKALKAEGVPVAEGYLRPLNNLPVFQRKIAMGKDGFPFTENPGPHYEAGLCPVAERCWTDTVVQIQPVSWDLGDDQIAMVGEAMAKIVDHCGAGRELRA